MQRRELKRREIDFKGLLKRSALEEDTDEIISEPGVFTENGKPVIIYGRFEEPLTAMRSTVEHIPYVTGERTLGLKSTSRTFGYRPRLTIRQDFCSVSSLALQLPKDHRVLEEMGGRLSAIYQQEAPEEYANHARQLAEVKPCWVIPGTPFTSGIVNKNNPLKYHRDFGNFTDTMSCMLVFRKDCDGGMLSVPEFNVRFMLADQSFFLFDGQKILHGVTPLHKKNAQAYRYSVVYYALKQMRNCGTPEEELSRIRKLKREREKKRLHNGS